MRRCDGLEMDSWREIPGEEEGLKVEEAMESAWNVSLERGEQKTGYGRLEATWLQVRSSLVIHSIQLLYLTPTQPHTMRVFSILTTAASYFVRNQKGNVTAARNTTAPLPPRFLILQPHLQRRTRQVVLFDRETRDAKRQPERFAGDA